MLEIQCLNSSGGFRQAAIEEENYIKACLAYFVEHILKAGKVTDKVIPIFHRSKSVCMDAWESGRVDIREIAFCFTSFDEKKRRYYGELVSSKEYPYFGELHKNVTLIVPRGYQKKEAAAGLMVEIRNSAGAVSYRFIILPYDKDSDFCRHMLKILNGDFNRRAELGLTDSEL